MLEFFAISSLAEHMSNKKKEEDRKMQEYFHENSGGRSDEIHTVVITQSKMNMNSMNLLLGIFSIIIAIFSARLAYNCNAKADTVVRIMATLFGFFFSGLYLIYYFIRYILMNNKCQ
jgi:hypothetical protein